MSEKPQEERDAESTERFRVRRRSGLRVHPGRQAVNELIILDEHRLGEVTDIETKRAERASWPQRTTESSMVISAEEFVAGIGPDITIRLAIKPVSDLLRNAGFDDDASEIERACLEAMATGEARFISEARKIALEMLWKLQPELHASFIDMIPPTSIRSD